MFKGKSMWVVKIGGSLLGSPELKQWLSLVAQHGDGQVVIVPGGGVFADAVRSAEAKTSLSARGAHRLAVLAMDQYAHLLADIEPNLVLASSELELAERSWQHRGIIWLPSSMVLSDTTIPESWDVTSDSLAAWLASKLDAKHLLLVKSMNTDHLRKHDATYTLQTLVADGVLDKAFPDFVTQHAFSTWLFHKTNSREFAQGFTEDALANRGLIIR
jgi:5-(aminomethyl)-3-furanmethanol phosphate kinase